MRLLLALACAAILVTGEPPVIHGPWGTGGVVQRDRPLPLWGTATPGAAIRATFGGVEGSTICAPDGTWRLELPALPAGGPHRLRVVCDGAETSLEDLLVGEIWICSGQSNMQWVMSATTDFAVAKTMPADPELRWTTVAHRSSAGPVVLPAPRWEASSAQSLGSCSAVAWQFGQRLRGHLGVPVGLILCAWGGQPAQAFTPLAALVARPGLERLVAQEQKMRTEGSLERVTAQWQAQVLAWRNLTGPTLRHRDPGDTGEQRGFHDQPAADLTWPEAAVPGLWDAVNGGVLPGVDGVVWWRRRIEVPAEWAGRDLLLSLGSIDDGDTTWWNGIQVGSTAADVPDAWCTPRTYRIPAAHVRHGENLIAIRVFDWFGGGGLAGPAQVMQLAVADQPGTTIPLAGAWRWQPTAPLPQDPGERPSAVWPGSIWNGMIAPLAPYAARGVLWYQGESNAGQHAEYRILFPTMIDAWRSAWCDDRLSFLFVQLPEFGTVTIDPAAAVPSWAAMRLAQEAALERPGVGMAVGLGTGDPADIHPRSKTEIARRLFQCARAIAYGEPVAWTGPIMQRIERDGDALIVVCANVGGGLRTRDQSAPGHFALCAADGTWRWAEASIVAPDRVRVRHPAVQQPTALRYASASSPIHANLTDGEGLPMRPFAWVAEGN
jgi:sialate O-acetylesterase